MVELLGSLEDVSLLENFVCGDTPTDESLHGLVSELLATGSSFDVSLYDLANRHDIRPLVLRTALTYLELRGVLHQGTPFYAGYKAKLLKPLDVIVASFRGERAQFVADVFAQAKYGRTWYTIDPAALAITTNQDRERIIRMLEYLSEQGWVELQVADARQRYTRNDITTDVETLVAELGERFAQREQQEIARLQQVVDLVTQPTCQTFALLRYFGENREGRCGHCTACETGQGGVFPELPRIAPVEDVLDQQSFRTLCREHADALGHPRQQARFLSGLTSPAFTRTKLSRHALFGICEGYRFAQVLEWCEAAT
jgi:ATP-dependent DNA helicase RecQ